MNNTDKKAARGEPDGSNTNDPNPTATSRLNQLLNGWLLPATICGVFLALAIIIDEVGK